MHTWLSVLTFTGQALGLATAAITLATAIVNRRHRDQD